MTSSFLTKLSFLILIFNFCHSGLEAQKTYTYNFINYNTDNGLNSNEVHCSLETQNGSMLFGTDDGLYQFDGVSFHKIPVAGSRSNYIVLGLKYDEGGQIWLRTLRNGLHIYKNDSLYKYKYNKQVLSITQSTFVTDFYSDQDGGLFFVISSEDSPFVYNINRNGELFGIYTKEFQDSLKGDYIKFAFGQNDSILFTRNLFHFGFGFSQSFKNKLKLHNKNTNIKLISCDSCFMLFNLSSRTLNPRKTSFYNFAVQSDSMIWINHGKRLIAIGPNYSALCDTNLGSLTQSLKMARDGRIIQCTRTGVNIVSFNRGDSVLNIERLLPNELITSFTEDREGGFWFTSTTSGIYYLPSQIFRKPLQKTIGNSDILTLTSTPSHLAFTTRKGLTSLYTRKDFNPILDITVNSKWIYLDSSIMRTANYLYSISEEKLKFVDNKIGVSSSLGFCELKDENKLVISYKTLEPIISSKNEFIFPAPNQSKINVDQIAHFDGKIVAGTNKGLFQYKSNTKTFSPFMPRIGPLKVNSFSVLKNFLCIGTNSAGLGLYNSDTLIWITEEHGLISNHCSDVIMQNDSIIWFASNLGLNRIIIGKNGPDITSFGKDDGMNSNKVNCLSISDNTLLIGTNKGLCWMDLDAMDIPNVSIPFKVALPNLNKTIFTSNDTVELKQGVRDIYLQINELSFRHNENLKYSFALDRKQQDGLISHNNSIAFGNLDPGYNTVVLNIASSSNIWNTKPMEIVIYIPYFFYETQLFKIGGSVFLFLAVLLSIMFYTRNKESKRKAALNLAMAQFNESKAKYDSLGLQLSPHFIFNSLNNIQYSLISKSYVTVNQFIVKLSTLTRNILEHAKLQLIPLSLEIENLKMYLDIEQIRFEDKPITIEWNIDDDLAIDELEIPPMILQPMVENALWHGLLQKTENRVLKLNFFKAGKGVQIEIIDNGVGLNSKQGAKIKVKGKTSIGIKNTLERIELYNQMNFGLANFSIKEIVNESIVLGTKANFTFTPSSEMK